MNLTSSEVETAMKYRLKRTVQVVRNFFAKGSWSKKALSLSYRFAEEVRLDPDGLHLINLGVKVPRNAFEFLLDSYEHLRNLNTRSNAKFYFDGDLFFVELGEVKLNLATAEEALIASEVYLVGVYQIVSSGRFVAVDIGMNVGFAAMFLASRPEVVKVYAFEPFTQTFDQAVRNFAKNPHLKNKIESYNYGLDGESRTLTVDFNYENKGQVGIHGTALILSDVTSVSKVDIVLKEASTEIRRIQALHPGESLMLKIDCEGAEYGIIKNLFDNDLFHRIQILCIEWHQDGPDSLIEILKKSGFSIFSQQSPTKKVGMIYAIK